jgi:hypothetical protein
MFTVVGARGGFQSGAGPQQARPAPGAGSVRQTRIDSEGHTIIEGEFQRQDRED